MACPICDQKLANCDCTRLERGQFATVEELEDEVERLRERVASLETCERHLQSQLLWLRQELWPVYSRTYNPNYATVWPRNVQEFVHTGVMPTHCMRDSGD